MIDNKKLHNFLNEYYTKHGWNIKEFNITGIRWEGDWKKDLHDDLIVYWTEDEIIPCGGTTQPGAHWIKNPMNKRGTATVCYGYYEDVWALGKHNKGKKTEHDAFIQIGNFKVWRDANKNGVYDKSDLIEIATPASGINQHADVYSEVDGLIGSSSAGCQVTEKLSDLKKGVELAKTTSMKKFSYGVINKDEVII